MSLNPKTYDEALRKARKYQRDPPWLLVQQWLVAPASWRVLHYIPDRDAWDKAVGAVSNRRYHFTAACGLRTAFDAPGIVSRLGNPRCKKCCKALGIPQGSGSGANDQSLKRFAKTL